MMEDGYYIVERQAKRGCPQGSVLGPKFCIVGTNIVGYLSILTFVNPELFLLHNIKYILV